MKIFLSHNSNDKEAVEAIGSWLTKKGYSVWLDKWCLTAGDSLVEKIGEGIETSDKLVVFLSPDSVDSNWVKKEVATGIILELAEEKGFGSKFVIPTLLKPCKIPIMLRDKLYCNFTDKSFESACNELLNGILDSHIGPLDKKLENRIIRHWNVTPSGNGKFALIIEFGVQITQTNGLHIGLDLRTNYFSHEEWFNLPNTSVKPLNTGGVFTNSASRIEPPIYARKFETPNVSSSKSFYIYFESDSEFKINGGVQFLDFYDREP